MKYTIIILLIIFMIFASAWYVFKKISKTPTGEKIGQTVEDITGIGLIEKKKTQIDPSLAKIKATELCRAKKIEGINFSQGPCLSNDLMPDWVADIAHNPRQPIDNEPENQCSAFREGKAHHFVELNENCEVIKVY